MKSLQEYAKEISFQSGKIILKGFRSDNTIVSYKSRTDLITNIDKASEEYLCGMINKKYPTHTIIAEEGNRKITAGEFIWYIDPLDGTKNYAHGLPFFCISIGIYSRDEKRVVIGVVYDPLHDEMFTALRGGGSYLNTTPIKVSAVQDIGLSMLVTGFPYNQDDIQHNNLNEFNKFLPRIQGIRRLGSAALDLSYVACGRFDGYWEPMLYPWDTAGGSIIVEEAGGSVSKYDGSSFDPLYPEIAASNKKIHAELLKILNTK